MQITTLNCYKDNYTYVLHNESQAIVFDACEFDPIHQFLEKNNLKLKAIFSTHHHWDHIGGNIELQKKYSCDIYGNSQNSEVPGQTKAVGKKDIILILNNQKLVIQPIFTPGHTHDHVIYYIPSLEALFTGDTFFSCGCGRLFEGTAQEMFESFQKISNLSKNTKVYFGHEYSLKNSQFALTVDENNTELIKRVQNLSDQPTSTTPTTLEYELKINPFLRTHIFKEKWRTQTELEVFIKLRSMRDHF